MAYDIHLKSLNHTDPYNIKTKSATIRYSKIEQKNSIPLKAPTRKLSNIESNCGPQPTSKRKLKFFRFDSDRRREDISPAKTRELNGKSPFNPPTPVANYLSSPDLEERKKETIIKRKTQNRLKRSKDVIYNKYIASGILESAQRKAIIKKQKHHCDEVIEKCSVASVKTLDNYCSPNEFVTVKQLLENIAVTLPNRIIGLKRKRNEALKENKMKESVAEENPIGANVSSNGKTTPLTGLENQLVETNLKPQELKNLRMCQKSHQKHKKPKIPTDFMERPKTPLLKTRVNWEKTQPKSSSESLKRTAAILKIDRTGKKRHKTPISHHESSTIDSRSSMGSAIMERPKLTNIINVSLPKVPASQNDQDTDLKCSAKSSKISDNIRRKARSTRKKNRTLIGNEENVSQVVSKISLKISGTSIKIPERKCPENKPRRTTAQPKMQVDTTNKSDIKPYIFTNIHSKSKAEVIVTKANDPKTPLKSNIPLPKDVEVEIPSNKDLPKPSTPEEHSTTSSILAKACIEYSRTAQHALSLLNHEVSTILRDSLTSIDDICLKVRQTVQEITESDKRYESFKSQQKYKSQSSPYLSQLDLCVNNEQNGYLSYALSLGLIQTQSENQLRLAVMSPQDDEKKPSEIPLLIHESELELIVPPLEIEKRNDSISEGPILPKLVQLEEIIGHPCSILKQQKKDIFNIPTRIPVENPLTKENCKQIQDSPATSPILQKQGAKKVVHKEVDLEVRQHLKEIATSLGLEDLPRSKARQDLHNCLIEEFAATDSLVEFEKKMKCAKKEEVVETGGNHQMLEIMAEELFVPNRQINKIAATNLNAVSRNKRMAIQIGPKTCQFLYREKKKKSVPIAVQLRRDSEPQNTKKTNVKDTTPQQKYADSLFFSSNKKSKQSPVGTTADSANSQIVNSDNLTSSAVNLRNKTPWPRTNLQTCVTHKTGLDWFDILDEISLKDLKPLESEYPRKEETGLRYENRVENTFLYKLVYGSAKEEFSNLLKVQEPSLCCSSSTCRMCKNHSNKEDGLEKSENNPVQKVSSPTDSSIHTKSSMNIRCSVVKQPRTDIIKKRRSTSADNTRHPSIGSDKTSLNRGKKSEQRARSKSKSQNHNVATKLRPYIFDPRMRYPTTVTVMPVSVHYENSPILKMGDCASNSNKPSGKDPQKKTTPDKSCNRYGRTATRNLVTYLEKQNVSSAQQGLEQHWDDNFYTSTGTISKLCRKKNNTSIGETVIKPNSKNNIVVLHPPASTPRKRRGAHSPRTTPTDSSKISYKKTLENNLENVIEMIENKIVDIISSPNKSHSETFDNVEERIVAILQNIRVEPTQPLEVINEDLDVDKPLIQCNIGTQITSKLPEKIEIDLIKIKENNATDGQLATQIKTNDTPSGTTLSSNEEHFTVTSSCSPRKSQNDQIDDAVTPRITDIIADTKLETDILENTEIITVPTVTSEEFLTPFMHALKQFRQEDRNTFNILEFLETLSTISEDPVTTLPPTADNKTSKRATLDYSQRLHIAHVKHEPHIFYSVAFYQVVEATIRELPAEPDTPNVSDELESTKQLFASIDLNTLMQINNLEERAIPAPMINTSVICCRMDTIIPQRKRDSSTTTEKIKKPVEKAPITKQLKSSTNILVAIASHDHERFLNSVYGILFVTIFFGLMFNYSCE